MFPVRGRLPEINYVRRAVGRSGMFYAVLILGTLFSLNALAQQRGALTLAEAEILRLLQSPGNRP